MAWIPTKFGQTNWDADLTFIFGKSWDGTSWEYEEPDEINFQEIDGPEEEKLKLIRKLCSLQKVERLKAPPSVKPEKKKEETGTCKCGLPARLPYYICTWCASTENDSW